MYIEDYQPLLFTEDKMQCEDLHKMTISQYMLCDIDGEIVIKMIGDHCDTSNLKVISGAKKTLWQNEPEVINSGVIFNLSDKKIRLQEAIFEILTSQASYVQQLMILEHHYMKKISECDPPIIPERDIKTIFKHFLPIFKVARVFLGAMLQHWKDDLMLPNLCDMFDRQLTKCREMYVNFVKNYKFSQECYQQHMRENAEFRNFIDGVTKREGISLTMDSFLALPFQRVPRLQSLLRQVMKYSERHSPMFLTICGALQTVSSIAQDCDDELTKMHKYEEMLKIGNELHFPEDVRLFPLVGSDRYLVLRSHVHRFRKRETIELFLFNDVFFAARRLHHSDKILQVIDYCQRPDLEIRSTMSCNKRTPMEFVLKSNSNQQHSSLTVVFDTEKEQQLWMDAANPKVPLSACPFSNGGKTIVQMVAISHYLAQGDEELSLDIGDIISKVFCKKDGQLFGERLDDGSFGWFPESCCKVITSRRLIEFNSTLRHRLHELEYSAIDFDVGDSCA